MQPEGEWKWADMACDSEKEVLLKIMAQLRRRAQAGMAAGRRA
jgi:hypothetical protein